MAISLKTTSAITLSGVKLLVYGESGSGKTRLCASAPSPIILSAESGLLSLQGTDIPYIEIKTLEDLYEAYSWLQTEQAAAYKTVCLDSISEIAEVVLSKAKEANTDARKAYGELADKMAEVIRYFRDLPGRNVYFSAKLERVKDENTGITYYSPSAPGNKVGMSLPYFFDEVLALRVGADEEGKASRMLQCTTDGVFIAKDRSGRLGQWEPADLSYIINKITGGAHEQAN